jgi:hypothetical protein
MKGMTEVNAFITAEHRFLSKVLPKAYEVS